MVSSITVVMYDEILYGEGRAVGKWGNMLARELKANIKAAAPVGWRANKTRWSLEHESGTGGPSGNLRRRISAKAGRTGLRQIEVTVTSGAYYSLYVIKGTRLYVRTAGGQFAGDQLTYKGRMFLPANGAYRAGWKNERKGQSRNDFMTRGVRATRANHSSLSGYRVRR